MPGRSSLHAVGGLTLLLLPIMFTACTHGWVPVTERSVVTDADARRYRVHGDDTLYSIAWRFGRDYRELARINDLRPPYTIYPGQVIALVAPRRSAAELPPATVPAPPPPPPEPGAAWRWPAEGRVVSGYGATNSGLDLVVAPGRAVVAAGPGEVVYAGGGLGGYRHLVIIKHDARYLSAYSLNAPVRVREGDAVKAGQTLADIVSTGTAARRLHFEIRLDGEPVDPYGLLEPG